MVYNIYVLKHLYVIENVLLQNLGLTSNEISFLIIADVIIIIYCVSRLFLEGIQICKRKLQYFLDLENWLEIAVFITSILFVIHHLQLKCFCPDKRTWTMGIIAVFLGWIDHIVFSRQIPFTGIIISIMYNIFITFVRLVLIAAQLIFAFALPFYMLLTIPVSACSNIT